MPSSQTCPEEAELLRLAMEDAVPAEPRRARRGLCGLPVQD